MYTKQEIILCSYREGKSQREISRSLGISRHTVRKYLTEYDQLLQSGRSSESVQARYLTVAPVYKLGDRSKLKLTREVQDAIDGFIELNRQKKEQGLRKQLMKKKDILDELHRQGFSIGYTSVCNYITNKEVGKLKKEAFIRQVYQPGKSQTS